jgi:hypothetical protein
MQGDTIMTSDQEGGKKQINSVESTQSDNVVINRGFELMLRHRSRREKKPKERSFSINVEKIISILKREINFRFEFSLLITKKR